MIGIAVLDCGRIGAMHATNIAAQPTPAWRQCRISTARRLKLWRPPRPQA